MKHVVLVGAVLAALSLVSKSSAADLVPLGSTWKYLDDGSDQGTAWREPGFSDASWASGPAQLGYGDGDEATVVSFGPDANNKYTTTYFRHGFSVPDPGIYTALQLGVIRDDGVVVYLNGVEINRNNMPAGDPAYNTPATTAIGGADESTLYTTSVNPSLLATGNNVLAAEIHQANGNSSDISFDLVFSASTEPVTNAFPDVSIISPFDNEAFTSPANILIQASASDSDGSVGSVEFYLGNSSLGQDSSEPFTFNWNGVGVGTYQLKAVATDNLGARSTSSVVHVTVNLSSAPTVQSVSPPAGSVNSLTQLTVTFSEPVQGVDAADLLINGIPAKTATGSSAVYTFAFDPPREGLVRVAWVGNHGITDFENPPQPFNNYGAGATWQYTLTDTVAPTVVQISPPAGATVRKLSKIKITFSEPVLGLDAADLLLNGTPASSVTGVGDGPYEFDFATPNNGTVTAGWASGHGITDTAAARNALAGGSWIYHLNTNAVFADQIVINEIMYHPSSERIEEEWVELLNRGSSAVNLTGWRLNRGVDFVFPNVSIPAGGYLVVAADLAAFAAKHPGVANVVGSWQGRLGNTYDEVELEDASGNQVDLISYADEGDFAVRTAQGSLGWEWVSQADGLGRSLELRNPALPRNHGQSWMDSTIPEGTPGQANTVASTDVPPLVLDVGHFPVVPRSSDPVTITARIVDEQTSGLTVRLWYRNATSTSLPAFTSAPMVDNGQNNDGVAGDGVYGAVLPAMANGTIIEFYVEARDAGAQTRTWPAAADQGGNRVQEANALYQVDDEVYGGTQPLYRLILRAADRNGFLNQFDRVQRNATFITVEGGDTKLRYNCGVRRRGASSFSATPPTMKLNIPSDHLWNNKSSMNLNSINTWAQVVGSAIALKAGFPVARARGVQVRFNGVNESQSGSQQYGTYAHVEVVNGEWARDRFPDDGNGNVYSKRRPECGLLYRGTNPQAYIDCAYGKESNASENDWSDLAGLLFALDPATTPDNEYVEAMRRNANTELWLRYFAVMFLMNYHETAICTGADDDYDLYRGLVDPRFMIVPHDFDTIFGSDGTSVNNLFVAADGDSGTAGLALINRFLRHPVFEPLYYEEYRRQLAGLFSTNNLFPVFDQVLGGWVPAQTIQSMKNTALNRINFVRSQLPAPTLIFSTVSGEPPSVTYVNSATLTVGGVDVTHYRYKLNNGTLSAETPVATPINLSGLADGTYTVFVIGRNAAGVYQTEANATASRTWTVLSSLKGVVFNEVLARNDSAVNHSGTFPDLIELYNAGSTTVNLEGMGLTDDPSNPNRYVFPASTSLSAGAYLILYANNPDGTTGLHLGFSLNQDGETLYLFDKGANGGRLLDTVEFGLQLPDLSVGRLPGGNWGLTTPTFGSANAAAPVGQPGGLTINEWLADGQSPFPDDFVEIYNLDPLPVNLGVLFMTDNPTGELLKHRLTPLSFIAGHGYRVYIADGNQGAGADHLNFKLSPERGEIALADRDGGIIDCVVYGPQRTGISQGRSPNGSKNIEFFSQPTPGAGNPFVAPPLPPETVTLIPFDQTWKYDQSGGDLGTSWKETGFSDGSWPAGPGLLGFETQPSALPLPILTDLVPPNQGGPITTYYRTHFNVSAGLNLSGLQVSHIIDDGAAFYLNGTEVGRFNMVAGSFNFQTTTPSAINNATLEGPLSIPLNALVTGDNVFAVEVHQQGTGSSDVVMGLELDAVILTNTPSAAGIVLNEVLASNQTLEEPDGSKPDWVELYNPSNQSVDVADMSLTDDLLQSRRWVFPVGSVVPAKGYLRIRCDSGAPVSSTNTGFGLKASGDEVYLFDTLANGGALHDSVTFGFQAPDWPIGRQPDGTANWTLVQPTPGAVNIAVTLGNARLVKVNEWMADPLSGDDWFELFNPDTHPVALGGWHLTDDLNDRLQSPIPALSFLGVGLFGFQEIHADGNVGAGADHASFKLSASGESIGLADAIGTLVDAVTFGLQTPGVSEGRLPDGSSTVVAFSETPTPGESNFLPIQDVVINEVLTHTDPPFEDAIELHNETGSPVNISGWFMSDAKNTPKKFQIPNSTVVPANGFLVFYEYQFNPTPGGPLSFALSSAKGDNVYLAAADAGGVLTGYRTSVEFGPSENAVSFGRYQTSVGIDFTAMSARTFGVDDPSSVEEFRGGTGLPNSAPKVGPIVINEIMYHPPDDGTNDNVMDEFIELHNITAFTIPLFDPNFETNTWRLRKAVSFDFPANVSLPPDGYLLVVSFDPMADPGALSAFRSTYGLSPSVVVLGPYSGKLDNGNESVRLFKPDPPQMPPSPDVGLVPYILVDRINYADASPWPTMPDGFGESLQRVTSSLYGNDPVNWASGGPTPGAANFGSAANTPPVLNPIGPRTVIESNLLTFTAMASDSDSPAQTLTYSLDAGAPPGASIGSSSGTFNWRPTEDQGPGAYSVTVRVTDDGSPNLSDAETILITVNEANLPPVLASIGNKTVNEGALLTFTATATDPDLPPQGLVFSLDAGAPGTAHIDPASGVFTWTPAEADGPGAYNITVRVTDTASSPLSDFETIAVTVNEVNTAPNLSPIGNRTVQKGQTLTFTASATDSDRPNQTLTYTLDAGAPSGATINASSGAFSWTPAANQGAGNYPVTVRVTDNGSPAMNDFENISIEVTDAGFQVELLALTHDWKYNDSGADLGTSWRETAYDDSSWPSGPALLYNETATLPGPKNTLISLNDGSGTHITTFYFRTHFFLPAEAVGVTLTTSNLIDDGAILYLNGTDAGRFNMPAGPATAATFAASSHEATSFVVFDLDTTALLAGDNVLAVEVHQHSDTSSDIVFGLALLAAIPGQTPIAITTQPAGLTVQEGDPAAFSVVATGSFPQYQWFKGTAAITGANQATYTIPSALASDAGTYHVAVSNLAGSVVSDDAVLMVNAAPVGPRITSITQAGGIITIRWESMAGKRYRLYYAPEIDSAIWNSLGGVINATGAISTATDSINTNQKRFYRVRLEN
jgi:Lamin Tail Domain/Bacterial Ig domain/CotH kinase protein/Putative Ig domain/Long Rib domain